MLLSSEEQRHRVYVCTYVIVVACVYESGEIRIYKKANSADDRR